MIHSRSRNFRRSWRKVCATVRANSTAMMTRNVQRKCTKAERSFRPTASKNWPFHSLSRTCPSMLAIVTTIEATKIASTSRPPCARRSTRVNKLRSRARSKSCMGVAATSSANTGLAAAIGIIGMIGGTACNTPGVSCGGRCEARIGRVDARSVFICGVQACSGRLPVTL